MEIKLFQVKKVLGEWKGIKIYNGVLNESKIQEIFYQIEKRQEAFTADYLIFGGRHPI